VINIGYNKKMTEITPKILTRGVEQILPDIASLEKLMSEKKIRIYLGIDPTGSLLTLGHSVVLRKLQQFADAGHQVILLIGNGTVRIGDPTGQTAPDQFSPTRRSKRISRPGNLRLTRFLTSIKLKFATTETGSINSLMQI